MKLQKKKDASKMLVLATIAVVAALSGFCAKPEELVEYPVSDNLRGHENTEWSTSYGFHLTDGKKDLPRVLLIGDSICGGYKDEVARTLENRMNVSFWISSYCVTSPGYLRLLSFYLDEAKYAVIHFNNGLHSLNTPNEDYERGLRKAFELIRMKQPNARIVWATSTPLTDGNKTIKARSLNAVAAKVVARFKGVTVNDLFSAMDPLDRKTHWTDTYHFQPTTRASQAKIVAEAVLSALNGDVKTTRKE